MSSDSNNTDGNMTFEKVNRDKYRKLQRAIKPAEHLRVSCYIVICYNVGHNVILRRDAH